MTDPTYHPFSANEWKVLKSTFHQGSADASAALSKWTGNFSVVQLEELEHLPLAEATDVLDAGDEPVCFCTTELHGLLTGEMILVFEDTSGLALADMLLEQPLGTSCEWTEMATSVAMETTNILSCAFLNSLSRAFSKPNHSVELLPSSPRFHRDFAEALLEFALIGQAVVSDQVFLARTRFEIDATTVNWTLLFVPDARSMSRLRELLISYETH